MKRSPKETFYYVGQEIPYHRLDRYRCLDATTQVVLQKARGRITLIIGALALCFAVIVGRLFYLTIVNYQARNFTPSVLKTEYMTGRQNIVDRHGIVLATSIPTADLSVNPSKIKNPEEVAEKLAKAIPSLSYEAAYQKLTAGNNFQYIKRGLTPVERNAVNWIGNPYLEERQGEKRVYPQQNLFSHLIGSVDIDNVGTAGLEKAYNEELKTDPVMLSLDTSVQEMTRQALMQGIQKYKARAGLSVVMNVKNGEILASVSLPDYNPNRSAGKKDDRFNKVSLGSYEFGSVFKLFNTAMALEAGDIRPTDSFDAKNTLKIGRKVIEDFRGQNRVLTVPEILIHSSNIGSARIALQSGWQKQRDFLGKLGFYQKLPIVLSERGSTLYPTGAKWADMTSASVAYGYGVSVTPLHLIAAVAAIANDGIYHVPTFIKDGNKGRPEYQVISRKTSEQMRHMMWAVINWEMKESNPVYGYAVGGKTGSANLLSEDGRYIQGSLRTSFVGVFPMDDPQYAVLVTLEDPKKIKETWMFNNAGWNARPIGLNIIAEIAPYLGVMPRPRWEQPSYIEQAIEKSIEYKKRKK